VGAIDIEQWRIWHCGDRAVHSFKCLGEIVRLQKRDHQTTDVFDSNVSIFDGAGGMMAD
jgi:hypothetical protein